MNTAWPRLHPADGQRDAARRVRGVRAVRGSADAAARRDESDSDVEDRRVAEEVVVNDTTATDDRRGNSLSTTLEESEIEELPEDPEELAEVLAAMAGGSGAVFQVNGFRGGRLPSRDEIRQIRFRTNSFSADNHDAGRAQIEIITRPNVRDGAATAASAIAATR